MEVSLLFEHELISSVLQEQADRYVHAGKLLVLY